MAFISLPLYIDYCAALGSSDYGAIQGLFSGADCILWHTRKKHIAASKATHVKKNQLIKLAYSLCQQFVRKLTPPAFDRGFGVYVLRVIPGQFMAID